MVECSQGCRFPVNLERHKYRDYVMCPRHHEKIKVRARFWEPDPDWKERKEIYEANRRDAKNMGKKKGRGEGGLVLPRVSLPPMLLRILKGYEEKRRESDGE